VSIAPRLLAIEPDPAQAAALRGFVQSCVDAELVLVSSVAAAKAAIDEAMPQAVLVSEVVAPSDDAELTAHVRTRAPGRPVPILPVPAMAIEEEVAATPRGPLRLIASRGTLTDAPKLQLARRQAALRQALRTILNLPAARPAPSAATVTATRRPRAPRWKADNVPWLTRVTTTPGFEARLLNISRSGVLIESPRRFAVGQTAAFELHGRLRVVVPARVVRSTAVAGGASDGAALYQSAALFDDDLPIFAPHAAGTHGGAIVSSDLGEVLAWVRAQARSGLRGDRIRAAFELSVQELVGARAVRLCGTPAPGDDCGDTVCVPVPASDGRAAFLQATYDAGRPPSPQAFERLTGAATLAADILEIETADGAVDRRE
jgi:hypothetical protein